MIHQRRRMIAVLSPAFPTQSTATAISHDQDPSFQGETLFEREEPPSSLEIPLRDQCGLVPNKVCAGEAQCICKDQWWSQCRVPLNGSWTPSDEENWASTGPSEAGTTSSSPSSPTDSADSISEYVARPPESSILPMASHYVPNSATNPTDASTSKISLEPSSPSSIISEAVPSSKPLESSAPSMASHNLPNYIANLTDALGPESLPRVNSLPLVIGDPVPSFESSTILMQYLV